MKSFKQLFIFICVSVFIGTALSSAAANDRETREVSGFNAIKVSSGIDLYLKMGDTESVEIVADDDIMDKIITRVEDGVLRIYVKDRISWRWRMERKAYVTVKEIEKIDASAGSDVKGNSTITAYDLEINASSGSDVELDVKVDNLDLDVSSGSDAKMTGLAKNFRAEASSGADIHASELRTKNCEVRVSSGSDASVNVSNELTARASSGGDIRYTGNPEIKDISESSGGDVYKR